ncbi:MAG TPA: aminoglycoside phosphotransferase [Halothiobacillaceae bacterium]|nr:aminoglycoside phosphotransferase [Halothiobacillaceae bacterium]
MTDSRLDQARSFFKTHCPDGTDLKIAFADASHRRYLRGQTENGSVIIMDAPPEKESVDAFLRILQHLAREQLPVPQLWAFDREQGFLLLEDLGDTTLYSLVSKHGPTVNRQALLHITDLLVDVAKASITDLPVYDKRALKREISLFTDWYLPYRCKQSGKIWQAASADIFAERCDWLCTQLAALPAVFVHRDYHSRNLMQRPSAQDPAHRWVMIDFQDAIAGPLGYDLISLLRDSYIDWPEALVNEAEQRFYHSVREQRLFTGSFADFTHQLGMIAVQRHLKVLGIFVRLSQRDEKHGYLADLPLTYQHLQHALARVPELAPLRDIIEPFAPEKTA